jgi:hypothetical protein
MGNHKSAKHISQSDSIAFSFLMSKHRGCCPNSTFVHDVFLEGQPALGLQELDSLLGVFGHHFENGVADDGIQRGVPDFILVCIMDRLHVGFSISLIFL